MTLELYKAIEDKAKSFNGGITNAVFAGAEACFEIMQAENQRLRKALEFYADRSNWTTKDGKVGTAEIWDEDFDGISGEPYQPSGGKRARAALKDPGGV